MNTKTIPARAFQQGCLALLDEVAAGRCEVIVTKHGKPVARLVPVSNEREREHEILASLRGKARVLVSEREFLRPVW